MRLLLLLLCLAFPRASSSDGNACEQRQHQWLWRVVGRERSALFFGTIHVPRSLVRLGAAAVRGLDSADRVLFELDLTDPRVAKRIAHCQTLPKGTTLSDVLPGELYLRLKRHLEHAKHSIPGWELYPDYLLKAFAGGWERRRPVWALLLLESLGRGGGGEVLDLWLARRALRSGKRPGAVERPEEHCLPLNALAPQQVVWALNRSLSRLEGRRGHPTPTDDLIRRYNCGDLDHFTLQKEEGSEEEWALERYFRRELIEKRNARMAQRVVRLLRDHPRESFFFAFGAGHFLGNGSVLDLVRDEGGFQVERVTSDIISSQSWEDDPHQGALRSPAPPPKHRHFNDLWVKMDRTLEEQSDQTASEPSLASSLVLDPLLWTLVLLVMA